MRNPAWKTVLFYALMILVSLAFLIYLIVPVYYKGFKGQYSYRRNNKQVPKYGIEDPIFTNQHLVNDSDDCIWYDMKDGLFQPTVEHPRFIVTGGAGFIGSHLVKRLRQNYKASQIKVLDSLWRGRLHNLQYKNGTWAVSTTRDFCRVDLRNVNLTLKYVRGADVIFHLANVVAGVSYVLSHQLSAIRDNILIDTNTLHAAKVNNVQNFIYVGTPYETSKVRSDNLDNHVWRGEYTDPIETNSSHVLNKMMEEYQIELSQSDDINIGIVHLHNVYGPYSDFTARTGQVIPSLITKVLNSENDNFVVWGSGSQYRDFIYIEDAVNSLILILEKGMNKGPIEIGTGRPTTIKELAQIITHIAEAKLHKKMKITFDILQPEGDSGRIANIDRAKRILAWQPRVHVEEGISETMSWIAENQNKQRILVIIIGQLRGGDLAWRSLHKFLLRPLNAHLALYITDWQTRTYLHNIAQYIWQIPEYDDWDMVFEMVEEICNNDDIAGKWRNYCQIHGTFMGGVSNCSHTSRSAVLFALRWLVQQKIVKLKLLDKYDWFVLTRADELYLCNHHDFTTMIDEDALLPVGEYYGGWSDRHIIGKPSVFMKLINITTELVCKPDYWFTQLQSIGGEFNIERIQKVIWNHIGLDVSEFSRSMFTVRTRYDPTSWSQGRFHPETNAFGLKVKYPGEFVASTKYCKIRNLTNVLKTLRRYGSNT